MKTVTIDQLAQHVGEEVQLRGWVYNKRSSGKLAFLILRDGQGIVQGILKQDQLPAEAFEQFEALTQESSLSLTGIVKEELPLAVGVPVITPVASMSDRPAGRAPAVREKELVPSPPDTITVSEYTSPTRPCVSAEEVTASGS